MKETFSEYGLMLVSCVVGFAIVAYIGSFLNTDNGGFARILTGFANKLLG